MEETEKEDRGTEIILHVAEDTEEFLNEDKIVGLLNKYCRFLPIPILCGTKTEWRKPDPKPEDENAENKETEEEKASE